MSSCVGAELLSSQMELRLCPVARTSYHLPCLTHRSRRHDDELQTTARMRRHGNGCPGYVPPNPPLCSLHVLQTTLSYRPKRTKTWMPLSISGLYPLSPAAAVTETNECKTPNVSASSSAPLLSNDVTNSPLGDVTDAADDVIIVGVGDCEAGRPGGRRERQVLGRVSASADYGVPVDGGCCVARARRPVGMMVPRRETMTSQFVPVISRETVKFDIGASQMDECNNRLDGCDGVEYENSHDYSPRSPNETPANSRENSPLGGGTDIDDRIGPADAVGAAPNINGNRRSSMPPIDGPKFARGRYGRCEITRDAPSSGLLSLSLKYRSGLLYSDPMVDASGDFVQRINELTSLQLETIRLERTRRPPKKRS